MGQIWPQEQESAKGIKGEVEEFIQEQKLTPEKDYRSFPETTPKLIKKHRKMSKKPCNLLQ